MKIIRLLFFTLIVTFAATPGFSLDRGIVKEVYEQLVEVMSAEEDERVAELADQFEREIDSAKGYIDRLKAGIAFHNASNWLFPLGRKGYAKKSYDVLLSMHIDSSLPEHFRPFVTFYLGSASALMGKEDNNPFNKISCVKQGIKFLDEGVNKYGTLTPLTYFIRGSVLFGLPSFFGKEKEAFEDFSFLEKLAARKPGSVDTSPLGDAYYCLGELGKKKNNLDKALSYYKKSTETDPSGRSAKESKEKLDIYTN